MSVSVEIIPVPLGSQLTSAIRNDDPEDKNDFRVLFIFSGNASGLTEDDITLSTGATLISLEGRNSVWEATIRPPETAGTVTVTLRANAVAEGNRRTAKSIRVSTSFPDTDADEPTELFRHGVTRPSKIAVTPKRISIITGNTASLTFATTIGIRLHRFTHAGVAEPGTYLGTGSAYANTFEVIDDNIWLRVSSSSGYRRYKEHESGIIATAETIDFTRAGNSVVHDITHTRLGFAGVRSGTLLTKTFDNLQETEHSLESAIPNQAIEHDNDLIYIGQSGRALALLEIGDDDTIRFIRNLNVRTAGDFKIYRDTLYYLTSSAVQTLDIRKYRPMAKNTKTTIYPVFATAGDTIDLKQFSPDAERIVFDVGFDKPSFLSINASNKLVIGSGAETCLVRLKAINRVDATETGSFEFYLIIQRAASPVWRDVSGLTMRAGSSVNLFNYVRDAESIAFRSGKDRLVGSRLSNGVFTIGTVGGVAHFTARNGNGSTHIEITIDVVQQLDAEAYSDIFRYRVEVAGIDVTRDLVGFPSVSETLDPVVINEYRVNEASIVLRNEAGKYNSAIAGNFWETNGLNAGGFQNGVKIYTEHSDSSGNWVENLLFTGVINESFEPIGEATFKLNCVDISSRLRKALVQDFGTLEKWDALRKQSDEDSYVGIYVPEPSLSPMQIGTGVARSDRTDLEISQLELPSEGPPAENTGYMTTTEFRTAGGFLDANPLLRFKTEHQSEDVRFLIHQLATNKEVYNTELDIPGVTVEDPFLLNRGSVAFSVDQTRATRLPVDWVYDSTNNRVLILLSNRETHIADQLVQYDVAGDSYRVLHTFAKDIAVHRIERRSGTNYYILTSAKIAQDGSARRLPRRNDSTAYAYDSAARGSAIKIYHYNTSTRTLTEHVAENNNFPPQLGLHYWIGFENALHTNTFEGIHPDYRGAFKWYSNNLYYRYAKNGEFGVARVNASGTVTRLMRSENLLSQNHLNFAFDVDIETGTVYFAYRDETEITVVETTGVLRNRGTLTIVNNLSGHSTPLKIRIYGSSNLVSFHSGFVRVVGTDSDGNTLSETVRFSNNRRIHALELEGDFQTITSAGTSNLQGGIRIVAVVPSLTIKQRTSSGTESTLLSDRRILERLTDLDADGGVFLGVHECLYHNNYLYLTVPIQRLESDGQNPPTHTPSRTKAAGMVLYRCDITATNRVLEVLDTWDFVHQAGCNLTVHDEALHLVEHPPVGVNFKPLNPDLDTYSTEMGYNVLPESLGALKKINSSGAVEELGNLWHSDRPFNVAATRCLSFSGDLHLIMGYGNPDEVLRYNSLASGADNMAHIVYGRTLHYVLPNFQPRGSVYAALADIAKSVNAVLSFRQNVVVIADRRPFRALTDGATGTGTGDLSFDTANKTFPESGYLFIGKEILKYTGISGDAFTGITRGVLGSTIADHPDNSEILYLDNLIQSKNLGSPYKAITLQSDTNRIFNVIRDSAGVAEVRDEESIARYGERPYTLNLGLTRHEKAWIEEVFASYLAELKDLQSIVNIQVVPDFSLRLGHIVPFVYAKDIRAMRIVSVRYEARSTHIKGRTL